MVTCRVQFYWMGPQGPELPVIREYMEEAPKQEDAQVVFCQEPQALEGKYVVLLAAAPQFPAHIDDV